MGALLTMYTQKLEVNVNHIKCLILFLCYFIMDKTASTVQNDGHEINAIILKQIFDCFERPTNSFS